MVVIEPALGDSYPALLRGLGAMRRPPHAKHSEPVPVLLFRDFRATSATLEQVDEMFGWSDARLVSLAEVEAQELAPPAE
jgi:hypothetical protein